MITIIAAVAANRAIGFENKLLYWLPNDLKRFKALTTGHTIIMGRRTFESLPKAPYPTVATWCSVAQPPSSKAATATRRSRKHSPTALRTKTYI